jgi:hypothetical protein
MQVEDVSKNENHMHNQFFHFRIFSLKQLKNVHNLFTYMIFNCNFNAVTRLVIGNMAMMEAVCSSSVCSNKYWEEAGHVLSGLF